MHYLITGASGFVGGNLARTLAARGHTVTALVRRSSNRAELDKIPGLRFAVGDLVTGDGLDEAVKGVECVQHLAGVVKARAAEDYYRANAEGTRLLCHALARLERPPRLVYCSSLSAAGPAAIDRPRREEEPPAPISTYGKSKLGGEIAVRQYADRVPSVIVRPPIVYGPGDSINLPPLLAMGRLGVFLKAGLGPKQYSFIHVDDLCEALVAASTRGKTISQDDPTQGIYFVADPHAYSWEEFCDALSHALNGRRARVFPLPEAVGYAVGLGSELAGRFTKQVPLLSRDKAREMRQPAWTCSPARAKEEIDFSAARDLREGLRHTLEWYRQEGLL
ncbi:MAG: NAD-dependent epimerase/dehydratase family protein [Myxococcales bacterium]|nr:NAD-dependent epimerase/dehydratase family protein [Myxococcales bacterium]